MLERVGDQREAGQRFVGADERRVDDRGHRDHHQRAQVRGPPPRTDAARRARRVEMIATIMLDSSVK